MSIWADTVNDVWHSSERLVELAEASLANCKLFESRGRGHANALLGTFREDLCYLAGQPKVYGREVSMDGR